MNCKLFIVLLLSAVYMDAAALAEPICDTETLCRAPVAASESMTNVNGKHQEQLPATYGIIIDKNAPQLMSTEHPKVVFQINQSADAPTILRFVTNYLVAEPTAKVVVVGYAGGAEFMLKGAKDTAGKPFVDQVQVLASKGVMFKVCNNTLKARNLTAEDVIPSVAVVPGAVNEIIRLQTREGYAYFRH